MAATQSEIRYLTPPSVDVKKKKYCRFKKKESRLHGKKNLCKYCVLVKIRIGEPY